MIYQLNQTFGRGAANRLMEAQRQDVDGAVALLETFYFAFNNRSQEVFHQVWAEAPLIQLNNPLGGIMRGYEPIAALYDGIFTGPARVWVELSNIVCYETDTQVVFAGWEHGEFARDGRGVPLTIRTSRVIQWFGAAVGWRQVHHHGSIDDAALLAAYQHAVRGE